jgi:hypothetical protein
MRMKQEMMITEAKENKKEQPDDVELYEMIVLSKSFMEDNIKRLFMQGESSEVDAIRIQNAFFTKKIRDMVYDYYRLL